MAADQLALLPLLARTTTQTLAFSNVAGRGIRVVINISAYTSGGLSPVINQLDAFGNAVALSAAVPTKLVATGKAAYEIYPGAGAASGGITAATSRAVGVSCQLVLTVDDATPITYSVSVDFLP